MKQATQKLAPYTPQPWAVRMIQDLLRLAIDPAKTERCTELVGLIEGAKISSLEAARRYRELGK